MDEIIEYQYRAKPWVMLGVISFFGACAMIMGYAALTNDRGLILNGVITLSIKGATIFYWCVAAVSVFFVIFALLAFIAGMVNPMSIRLTATELFAPKHGFTHKSTILKLHEINKVNIQTVQKQRFMTVYTQDEKMSIAQSMLPNSEAFDSLYTVLVSRTNILRRV